jgi:hypothetical protein
MPRKSSKRKADLNSVHDFRHTEARRKNNPPAGFAPTFEERKRQTTRYTYDPHLDPQLQWAGKAEHTSFEVDVVSLHIHERISTRWQGVRHEYRPDFLIRWRCWDGREVKIILEVKGFETEQDRQKEAAARRWVRAVNHHGEFGRWAFAVCKDPAGLKSLLLKEIEALGGGCV